MILFLGCVCLTIYLPQFSDLKFKFCLFIQNKMERQVEEKERLLYILFKFKKLVRHFCEVYSKDKVGESTARKWFSRFKKGHFEYLRTFMD